MTQDALYLYPYGNSRCQRVKHTRYVVCLRPLQPVLKVAEIKKLLPRSSRRRTWRRVITAKFNSFAVITVFNRLSINYK